MAAFILYLIKATICLTVFSVFFRLLLMKETFFRFTRMVLLSGLIICSVLPLVKIKTSQNYSIQEPITYLGEMFLSEKIVEENNIHYTKNEAFNANHNPEINIITTTDSNKSAKVSWYTIGLMIYWTGFGLMVLRFLISFVRIRQLISKSKLVDRDGYKLAITDKNVMPFSFFRYVVLSENDYADNPNEIILHEKMHMRSRHNLDVLFSELLLMVHWFNPMVWLLSHDLREIHEYEADNAVICKGIDATKYQLLLVKKAVGERRFTSVVNSFNQSKIKNRITMMLRKESSKWARIKALIVVPLAAVMLIAFAQPEVEKKAADILLQDNPESVVKQVQSDPLFYWNQMQEYLKKNGSDAKELERKLKDGDRKNVIPIFINNLNQALIRNYNVANPEDLNSDTSIDALRSMIVNEWEKRKEGILKDDEPLIFALQYDGSTHTDAVMQILKSTLPNAYENAIKIIAQKEDKSTSNIRKDMPLLLVNYTVKYTDAPAPPPPPTHSSVAANSGPSVREKLIRNGEKIFSIHSVSGISQNLKISFNDAVDTVFPKTFKRNISWHYKQSGIKELNDVIISLGPEISREEIAVLDKTLTDVFQINNIVYSPRVSLN